MEPLSAADMLELWQAGSRLSGPERALALLRHAAPQLDAREIAALPVGRCDAALLQLRHATFGSAMSAMANCPECGATLEFDLDCEHLLAVDAPAMTRDHHVVDADGHRVVARAPVLADLLLVARCADLSEARRTLLRLCVTEARQDDRGTPPETLPPAVVDAIGRTLLAADPGAETLLDFACPACRHRWQAVFDIAAFFWTELAAQARRLLLEVHLLARAYGWREADVLGLPQARRAVYLELVSS